MLNLVLNGGSDRYSKLVPEGVEDTSNPPREGHAFVVCWD